jgi:transposase
VLFSIRSERQLVEQITYNLLFRWFVGLSIDDVVWNHSVFSKNRDRLIEHEAVTEMFNATVDMADKRGLLSGEHFSVDGTLRSHCRADFGAHGLAPPSSQGVGTKPHPWPGTSILT